MLHLAQVQKNPNSGKVELQLLAHQESEGDWLVSDSQCIPLDEGKAKEVGEGMLVLVKLGEQSHLMSIEDATEWVVTLVSQYFPLKQEEENWRQDLTSQSQDLTRRNLEIETRTEQIQELEEKLKQEKEIIESRWLQIQALEEKLKQEKEELEGDNK